jgi:2-oxoglutarate/2-oxoacid ferredoxin oxidoreductase subunit alpha
MIASSTVRVNDFAIMAATVNGSGSQTANLTLIRALFRMGIPVNGKNLFPSNISGEPTWFTMRVSRAGFTARPSQAEILVAFNGRTAADDLAALPAGGLCLYPGDGRWQPDHDDVLSIPLPVKHIVAAGRIAPNMRDYAANMVYVGALAALLGIELAAIREALQQQFKGKSQPVALNFGIIQAAAEYAGQHYTGLNVPFGVERMDATAGQILIDGNTAAALGAIFGGVSVVSWYPITPATSLANGLQTYLPRLRRNTDGRTTYAIIQAEDEIAALGMAVGAGWAGARAMTSTSGPGISLMTEFAGLAYFAEIPVVIWDVQRVGPSTGMPTRTAQGDLLATYFLGHGDTRHVVLLPGTVGECFEFGYRAFDLAERLQTPVFVLSDLDLGMNLWMSPPFEYPAAPMDRGKVLSAAELEQLGRFLRFEDRDGDGVGYRTLPGNPHPLAAQLSRGTGHNVANVYSEQPEDWQQNMARLGRKHETARNLVPSPIIELVDGAEIGLITSGSAESAVQEARAMLAERGIATSYMRVRALPLNEASHDFVARQRQVLVIELNQDGQLRQLLQLHCPEHAARIGSIAHNDGLPLTADFVADRVSDVV